ncbi:MAG: hypothetical protein R3Y63_08965 [Eubacteriales bacterium]
MSFEYMNSFVNSSPTVREVAGEELVNACHKAVAYDEDGEIVIASTGKEAIGLLLSSTESNVSLGEEVDVLMKDVGLLVSAEAISKGNFVTIADGCGKVATSGTYIFGRAMTESYEAGDVIQVRVGAFGSVMA